MKECMQPIWTHLGNMQNGVAVCTQGTHVQMYVMTTPHWYRER